MAATAVASPQPQATGAPEGCGDSEAFLACKTHNGVEDRCGGPDQEAWYVC